MNGGVEIEENNPTRMARKKMKASPVTKTDINTITNNYGESTKLENYHIVTKTKFTLGHSHFMGRLIEQNNLTSKMKKCELNITLTTSRYRPDLVPSLEKLNRNDSSRSDVFNWLARETKDKKGKSSHNEGQKDKIDERFVPMTVSSALAESKKRISKLMVKDKISRRKKRRDVLEIKKNTKNLLRGIKKERKRSMLGDVNELANELSGLNQKSKK